MTQSLLKTNIAVFAGLFAAFFLVYHPAVFGYYVSNDDLSFFYGFERSEFNTHSEYWNYSYHFFAKAGRYLEGFLRVGYGALVHSVRDLGILRFMSIVNLSLTGVICFHWVLRYLRNPWCAFLFTVLIFTLPPFESVVSSATLTFISQAVLLAAAATIFAAKALEAPSFKALLQRRAAIAAIFLLVCALMTYQPAAMFYWVWAALFILTGIKKAESRRLRNLFLIGFSAIIIYAAIVGILKGFWVVKESDYYNIRNITTDWVAKARWFIQFPFKDSLNLWNIFPSTANAAAALGFILLMYAVALFKADKEVVRKIQAGLIFFVLVILSFLPNLAAAFNFPWYRSCVALTPVILIMLLWAVKAGISYLFKSRQEMILTVLLAVVCIGGMLQAYRNVLWYRVSPSTVEFQTVLAHLKAQDITRVHTVQFLLPLKALHLPEFRYDEFVILCSSFQHNVAAMVKCALRELGIDAHFMPSTYGVIKYARQERPYYVRVEILQDPGEAAGDEGAVFINLRDIDYVHPGR